jgi:hypothetical protein
VFGFFGWCLFSLASFLLSKMTSGRISVMQKPELPAHAPWILKALWLPVAFLHKIGSWPWVVLLFLLFGYLAVVQRREEKGWASAFVAGVALLGVLHEIIFQI